VGKKILFLTHLYPLPPNDGGKIVTFNTLKELVNFGHEIVLFSFYSKEKDDIENNHFNFKIEKYLFPVEYNNSYSGIIKNFFSNYPYNMEKYINIDMEKKILKYLDEEEVDLIYIDHLHMSYYGEKIKEKFPQKTLVLRQHNVESQIMKRASENSGNLIMKVFLKYQYRKLYKYEKNTVKFYDECFMITQEDLDLLKSMNKYARLSVLPAGVDLEKYKPINKKLVNRPTITFLGSMSWLPNIDGVTWFSEEILPDLIQEIPNLIFYIVGKNPPESIKKIQTKYPNNVIVTGFVDDERPYIASSDVFIVPLRIGGGMRIKILNALAMKKVIVSTKIGAEGIALSENSIFIANESDQFGETIKRILTNPKLSKIYEENGYQDVISKYSSKVILSQHALVLNNMSDASEVNL